MVRSKQCKSCLHTNHFNAKVCKVCGDKLGTRGRPRGTSVNEGYEVGTGRPTGTSASEGYNVSSGRPTGTSASEGYNVGTGRPTGTSACEGYNVGTGRPTGTSASEGYNVTSGRPTGSSASEGYNVSSGRPTGTSVGEEYNVSSGRPTGTSASEGYNVGTGRPTGTSASEGYNVSSGRPTGTSASEGYNVGTGRPTGTSASEGYSVSRGRRPGAKNYSAFLEDLHVPTGWDTSAINIDSDLLGVCHARINQQRTFDKKSLGVGVCYGCGHVLWSRVDGSHTFLVDKPQNISINDAPAAAYLRAVPDCSLSFEHGSSTKRSKWYSCSYCRTATIPLEQHVGHVFGDNGTDIKPVPEWDMTVPKPLKELCNKYETGQVGLCGLFSDTVKKASMSQYQHLQGEINAIKKLDRHYYGLFGFMAIKDADIFTHSPDPCSSLRIKRALRWLRANNHLYSSFFSHYDTLLRFVKPSLLNPNLLEKQDIPLERLLEGEAAGMAFPLDAKYFDDFPLIFNESVLGPSDIAGRQYPQPDSQASLQNICHAKYGEKYLDVKVFPHLHPYGHGGWYHKCHMAFQAHIKMRLFDIRGTFAADYCSCFFKYDYMVKVRLRMYHARKVVKVQNLAQPLSAGDLKNSDPYAVYGTEIPRIIPGSRQFWKSFGLDLVSFVEQRGLPQFFLTLTAHDLWPQVQTTLAHGWGSCASEEEVQSIKVEDRQPV